MVSPDSGKDRRSILCATAGLFILDREKFQEEVESMRRVHVEVVKRIHEI